MDKPKSAPAYPNVPTGVKRIFLISNAFLKKPLLHALKLTEDSSKERLLYGLIPSRIENSTAIIGPVLGAPPAVMALEPFLNKNKCEVVLLGTCGGIKENYVSINQALLANTAYSEVGTSSLYGGSEIIDVKNKALISELESAYTFSFYLVY